MMKMFDFSKMEDTPLKQDLQNPGQRPAKNSAGKDSTANPQKLAFKDALSLADQSAYYNANGTPREPSGQAQVTFGDETTMGTGLDDNDSIKSDEEASQTGLAEDESVEVTSVVSNRTSVLKRSAGSIARERHFSKERDKFNSEIGRIKGRHDKEMAELQRQMEILRTNQLSTVIIPPDSQATPPPNGPPNQANSTLEEPTSDEDAPYVNKELEAEIMEAEGWMRCNGIPIPPGSTTEENSSNSTGDSLNQDVHKAAEPPHTKC
jgi:hypothetical protein